MSAVVPAALANTALGEPARVAIGVLRLPALAIAMVVALSVLYRLAPDRDDAQWRWVGLGSLASTSRRRGVGRGRRGDALAFLTAYLIVLGAELNSEAERQTARDTTTGRDRPLGERDAEAADTVGPTAHEVKAGVPAGAVVASVPERAGSRSAPRSPTLRSAGLEENAPMGLEWS